MSPYWNYDTRNCKISMTQILISMIQVQKWLMTVRNGKYLMKRFATSHRSLQTAISRNAISTKECHKPTAVKTFGIFGNFWNEERLNCEGFYLRSVPLSGNFSPGDLAVMRDL